MPVVDPPPILIAAFLLAVFYAVVFFVIRRTFRDTIPGLTPWAWACFLAVLASALFATRAVVPSPFSIVVSNSVLTGSFLLMLIGLREFTGQARNHGRPAGAFLANVLVFTLIVYNVNTYRAGLAWVCFANGSLFFACALAIVRARRSGVVERLTGGVFALAALISFARFLSVVLDVSVPSHLFDPLLLQRLYLASFPFVVLAANIGFMLMVNQRVHGIVVGMNANLESAVERRTAELRAEIARREGLEREVAQSIDMERHRIGQELHDNLGQRMVGLSLLAEALSVRLKTIAPALRDQADTIERTASEAAVETRRLAHGMMPVVAGGKGLGAALTELAASASLGGRLRCSYSGDAPIEVEDESVATHLFRIAQESVSNLLRHGHATEAAIRLGRADGRTTLSITDNGVGFSPGEGEGGDGRGLRIIAYRAALIGYDLDVDTAVGAGTIIRVSECRTQTPRAQ